MMDRDISNDDILLHALADGELDAATSWALEQRMAQEPALAAAYDEIVALKAAVGRLGTPVVSDAFHARIAALAVPPSPTAAKPSRPNWLTWSAPDWRAMAAALVLTAVVSSSLTYTLMAPHDVSGIEEVIASGHRRSLLAASPIDIASSDRHTVRPWFDAKLGIAPPTPDLVAQGFALVGGRVDVVGGRALPTLVYKRGGHLITVVTEPARPGEDVMRALTATTAGGYNVARWSGGGFHYWALSDLDATELARFAHAIQAAAGS